jgi:hypothetical protein
MEAIIESIVLASGTLVLFMGTGAAILLIGFMPLYIASFFYFGRRIKFMSSRTSILLYSLAIVVSLCISSLLAATSMVLRMWG